MKKLVPLLALTAMACGEKHARVDVKDAPTRTGAWALTLDGAKILVDKGGQFDKLCASTGGATTKGGSRCTPLHFYVFPVVDAAWTGSAPIPAWVTCTHDEDSLSACEAAVKGHAGDIRGSVAVRVGDRDKPTRATSGWETAIEDATKRHGLQARAGAPVLRLGRD